MGGLAARLMRVLDFAVGLWLLSVGARTKERWFGLWILEGVRSRRWEK
jgi:hypothetical protein